MKKIPIKNKRYGLHYAIVDDDNYDELIKIKWYLKTDIRVTGRVVHYAQSTKGFMHRIILNLKKENKLIVDHINHNGLDNTKNNIRICNHSENNKNLYGKKGRIIVNDVILKMVQDKIKVTPYVNGYAKKSFIVLNHNEAITLKKELLIKYFKK